MRQEEEVWGVAGGRAAGSLHWQGAKLTGLIKEAICCGSRCARGGHYKPSTWGPERPACHSLRQAVLNCTLETRH